MNDANRRAAAGAGHSHGGTMRLTPARVNRLEILLALPWPLALAPRADLEDLLADLADLQGTVARLEQRLQDAEGDARRFCGLAGAALRERMEG